MMFRSPFVYFTDPVLRAPTIGCMLMCLAASIVGVLAFVRRRALLGEALSHATYPGVILAALFAALFFPHQEEWVSPLILVGALGSSLVGLWIIDFMERRLKVNADAALCFVLSAFFSIGLTIASRMQFTYPSYYKKALVYLYGQAATMTDYHIVVYGVLVLVVVATVTVFYREFQISSFDKDYAKSVGVPTRVIDLLSFVLVAGAVVIGIRSVGIVLMSGMLIAPAATARQYTHRLHVMMALAAVFGIVSGFLGNYLSTELSRYLASELSSRRLALPTGPSIVLVASFICVFSLFFSPERGLVLRWWRVMRFRRRCLQENIMKAIWRLGRESVVSAQELSKGQNIKRFRLFFLLGSLVRHGWLSSVGSGNYKLTPDGYQWAARIVRLHRLWEVYLVEYVGVGIERVHRNAEEMEHIITPELEAQLIELLDDPKRDPHDQPIPSKGEVF